MILTGKEVSNDNDLQKFKQALENAGLPHSDLNYTNQSLILFFNSSTFVGTGGLEAIDNVGLLRSISIAPAHRNKNFGKQIVREILKNAQSKNMSRIYLLTETARDYFKKLGFTEIEREEVAPEIKSTSEFMSVCPTSATCMMMRLK